MSLDPKTPTRPPAKRPCGSCPYRQDAPSGLWAAEEYEKLPNYDKPMLEQPQGAFMCHQQDHRLCAGWVGCHDMGETFAFRLNAHHWSDEVIDAALDYETDVPLFTSGQEARDHGMKEIDHPSERTQRIVNKLVRTKDVRLG
jgi:hypothetical protein